MKAHFYRPVSAAIFQRTGIGYQDRKMMLNDWYNGNSRISYKDPKIRCKAAVWETFRADLSRLTRLAVDNFCPSIFKSKAMEGAKHIENMIQQNLCLSEMVDENSTSRIQLVSTRIACWTWPLIIWPIYFSHPLLWIHSADTQLDRCMKALVA